jgi:hypothetical protein
VAQSRYGDGEDEHQDDAGVGGGGGGGGGPPAAPPPPSALVRSVLWVAEQPYEAAAGAALAGVALVAIVLARRPKVPVRRG